METVASGKDKGIEIADGVRVGFYRQDFSTLNFDDTVGESLYAVMDKKIEVELVPQGTFSERIRAAGMGIRAFYTPTGYGTVVAEGKDVKIFDRPCILETALHADYAIIKAEIGDKYGNLWFKETARNFSPLMAMAAKVTIVEVEKLVEVGEIAPEDIHLPGIFVQRIFQGSNYKNDIEFLKLSGEN